jgi:hypothetical protein
MDINHNHRCFFERNPYISGIVSQYDQPSGDIFEIRYMGKRSDKGPTDLEHPDWFRDDKYADYHMLDAFIADFNYQSGLNVELTARKPDLHRHGCLQHEIPFGKPYWIIGSGGKLDMPTKIWSWAYWQKVVDFLTDRGITCVQIGKSGCINFKLKNVIDIVGKVDDLDVLTNYFEHAQAIISHVSFPMHLAAALGKKCFVIGGGRERPSWYEYDGHDIFHTIGDLHCCLSRPCFRQKVWMNNTTHHKACVKPNLRDKQVLPECMLLIEPDAVISKIEKFLSCGVSQNDRTDAVNHLVDNIVILVDNLCDPDTLALSCKYLLPACKSKLIIVDLCNVDVVKNTIKTYRGLLESEPDKVQVVVSTTFQSKEDLILNIKNSISGEVGILTTARQVFDSIYWVKYSSNYTHFSNLTELISHLTNNDLYVNFCENHVMI